MIINGEGTKKKKFLRSWANGGEKMSSRRLRSDGVMAERRPNLYLRRKCATVLRLGTGDVIPGMRALPAELRDAQDECLDFFN